MKLPPLFKRTSTGAIQYWSIMAWETEDAEGVIRTTFGHLDGKLQTTEDVVREGKNPGKSNATSPFQQASKEAEAKWTKQKKAGYVDSKEDAEAGKVDDIIEGGIVPMLAHRYDKDGHKMVWPALASPKLDGLRAICQIVNGKCTLWSRTRKQIKSVPHIVEALEKLFPNTNKTIDGELYVPNYRHDFEKIVSLVRQDEPEEGYEIVEYHIFDIHNKDASFSQRYGEMTSLFAGLPAPLVVVPHVWVNDEEEMMEAFQKYMADGYEGLMLRNPSTPYECKRSFGLLKVKLMQDSEFKIVGIEEGRGRLQGHVGAFVCLLDNGQTFKAKPMGETSRLKEYFENPSLWREKFVTVQFQNLSAEGTPRFPVAKSIREGY